MSPVTVHFTRGAAVANLHELAGPVHAGAGSATTKRDRAARTAEARAYETAAGIAADIVTVDATLPAP